MKDTILSQLAALKGAPTRTLKARWRELFDTEPPAYNRRFLESRLAYRIQELAYGGLSRQTLERLRAMAKQYATRDSAERKARPVQRPIAGTQLIREYQGIEHCVTVRADDFEYLGTTSRYPRSPGRSPAPNGMAWCSSASSVTRDRNDASSRQTSQGLRSRPLRRPAFVRGEPGRGDPQAALRGLYPQIQRGRARHGVQLARCPARGLPGVYRKPARRRLASG